MNLLIVDDEPDVKMLFEQRFRRETKSGEISLNYASSGKDAIEILENYADGSIMVLSDINMPEMNGFELLSVIRQKFNTPVPVVVMISAYGQQDYVDQAKQLGANDFVTKPVDFAELKEKIRSLAS